MLISQIILLLTRSINPKFVINFFRFLGGCFFECLPISSSFYNTLFYKIKDEHKIEKNNINIHLLTGIASGIMFCSLSIKNQSSVIIELSSYTLINLKYYIFSIIAMIASLSCFYLTECILFFKWSLLVQVLFFWFNCLIFNHFYWFQEINSIFIFINFLLHLINIYILHNLFINIIQWIKNFLIKILGLIMILGLLLFLLQFNKLDYYYWIFIINFFKSWVLSIFINKDKYNKMLFLSLFAMNYFSNTIIYYHDLIILLFNFIFIFLDKYYFNKYPMYFHKEYFHDNFLKFSLLSIIGIWFGLLLLKFPIIYINPMIFSPVGLLWGLPVSYYIKKKIYTNNNKDIEKFQSIIISFIITIIFIYIFFIYQKNNVTIFFNNYIKFFILGFFNSFALIPGFSRMLLTFMVGLALKISLNQIILVNYCLGCVSSIGQWFIYELSMKDLKNINYIMGLSYKKLNELLLMFGYKENKNISFIWVILLIIWSYCLMIYFLPYLYTVKFWQQSIVLRIFGNIIFFTVLNFIKKKN